MEEDVPEMCGLKTALQFRWTCLGYDFGEDYAALLAKTLHAQGLSVINDIDHFDWELVPIDKFGLGLTDVQVLNMTKLGNDELAHQLIINAWVMHYLPELAVIKRVANAHTPFCSQTDGCHSNPKTVVVNAKPNSEGFVFGSINRVFMKPLAGASRVV